jgi:hypothetical protein
MGWTARMAGREIRMYAALCCWCGGLAALNYVGVVVLGLGGSVMTWCCCVLTWCCCGPP